MADNTWRVRDMDPETRKKIKMYAVEHDLSVAEAIKRLVDLVLGKK